MVVSSATGKTIPVSCLRPDHWCWESACEPRRLQWPFLFPVKDRTTVPWMWLLESDFHCEAEGTTHQKLSSLAKLGCWRG